jgi:hypothetical protein
VGAGHTPSVVRTCFVDVNVDVVVVVDVDVDESRGLT